MTSHAAEPDHDIVYPSAIPFVLIHLACGAALWSGVTLQACLIGLGFYLIRMFAIGAGYHRLFSHRAYATSRVFQFALAFLAQSTAQKSILWWAAKHRHHHLHSDTPVDVHSPRQRGFLYAHLGWIFALKHDKADLTVVEDWTRFPELVLLHRLELLPAFVLAGLAWAIGGWSGLVVGFVWSTVAVYHVTFCINSLAHVYGSKRYVTGDDSRNNWWLALMTLGEGWHNNHHAYQASARQGFRWWEIDVTFYTLRALAALGLVWDLRAPPRSVVANERRLASRIIEKAASDVARAFGLETDAAGHWMILRRAMPTREAIAERASALLPRTPSFDAIVDKAHALLAEAARNRARLQPAR